MYLGPKEKTDYLILNEKLLLINVNHVGFFFFFFFFKFFFFMSIDTTNLTKLFTSVDVAD